MDKDKISKMNPEEIAYMRRMMEERFSPTMFHTEKDREVLEKGKFRAIILPSMSGNPYMNPFIIVGLTMIVGSFFFSMRYGGSAEQKSLIMLDNRVKFQSLTIASVMGGYYCSSLRNKNRAKLEKIEQLKAELM